MRTITLEELKKDLMGSNIIAVNINQVFNLCGASPIHIDYKTDKVIIKSSYPECIVLHSGISSIILSQIKHIVKKNENGRNVYDIICGISDNSQTVVTISPIQ